MFPKEGFGLMGFLWDSGDLARRFGSGTLLAAEPRLQSVKTSGPTPSFLLPPLAHLKGVFLNSMETVRRLRKHR